MSNFSIIAIRVLENTSEDIRKVLKDEWYLFNSKYKIINNKPEVNNSYPLSDDFFGKNISISAIVGKNGSGKSTILDIILRIINNLAERLLQHCNKIKRNESEDFYHIDGLDVELYFELNSKRCCLKIRPLPYTIQIDLGNGFKQYGTNLDINATNNQIGGVGITLSDVKNILNNFFYTMVVNYSIHAYNKRDYSGECDSRGVYWVNSLFHKNDGYLAPLVITPYRGEEKGSKHCVLDIDKEFNLTNSRLSALLLQYKFEQEKLEKEGGKEKLQNFIDGYKLKRITFHYDYNYVNSKYVYEIKNETKDKKKYNDKKTCLINLDNKNSIFSAYVDAYSLPKLDTLNNLIIDAYKYLIYKTNMISLKYPSYKGFYKIWDILDFNNDCDDNTKQKIKKLVHKIQRDDSHITIKIKQTLHFINQLKNSKKDYSKDFEDKDYAISSSENSKLSLLDNVMTTFPPPFFVYKIYFTKENTDEFIEFGKMSSGERQFLFSMSTVLYHIKNLMSVPENDRIRVKYKNFNIILDEIELCFHPEYQRQFVNRLINYLSRISPTEEDKEKYHFNIILATHSPFILSDIPETNVLFLESGKSQIGISETFGANIHSLYQNNFFINGMPIGEFAKNKINNLFEKVRGLKSEDKVLYDEICLIGEPLLRSQLLKLYAENCSSDLLDRIQKLENELKTLKEKND